MAASSSEFSCRIVDIDYYLAAPIRGLDVCYSTFSGSAIDRVPVVRVFGATPCGQKCCAHVHGTFPYLYIPSPAHDPTDRFLHQLGRSIDHALQVSLGAGSREGDHIFKISVVRGIPFYGYHKNESVFLKIFLYNPAMVKRVADLLGAGAIMNLSLQPHESHIPFVLQFMIDHSLYGMNFINTSSVKFRIGGECPGSPPARRSPTPRLTSPFSTSHSSSSSCLISPSLQIWDVSSLPRSLLVHEPRVSTCELEVDVQAVDIINREEIGMVSGGYPGLTAVWEEEQQRRESLGLEDPLAPPHSPDRHCQLVHMAEEDHLKHWMELMREKSPEGSNRATPPPSVLSHLSQSCELETHQPIRMPGKDAITMETRGEVDVVVDEEAVQRSVELSQRLADASMSATDAELLKLLTELAHSQSSAQVAQPTSSEGSSHSVANTFLSECQRAFSTSSSHSSFSDGSKHEEEGNRAVLAEGSVLSKSLGPNHLEISQASSQSAVLDVTPSPDGSDIDLFEGPIPEPATGRFPMESDGQAARKEEEDVFSVDSDDVIPCNQCDTRTLVGRRQEYHKTTSTSKQELDNKSLTCLSQVLSQAGPALKDSTSSPADIANPTPSLSKRSLSFTQRQQLLDLCQEREEVGVANPGESSVESEGEEEESILMSQAVWGDVDANSVVASTESPLPSQSELDNRNQRESVTQQDDFPSIPQLDGSRGQRKQCGSRKRLGPGHMNKSRVDLCKEKDIKKGEDASLQLEPVRNEFLSLRNESLSPRNESQSSKNKFLSPRHESELSKNECQPKVKRPRLSLSLKNRKKASPKQLPPPAATNPEQLLWRVRVSLFRVDQDAKPPVRPSVDSGDVGYVHKHSLSLIESALTKSLFPFVRKLSTREIQKYRINVSSPSSGHTQTATCGLRHRDRGNKLCADRGSVLLSPEPPCQAAQLQMQSHHSFVYGEQAFPLQQNVAGCENAPEKGAEDLSTEKAENIMDKLLEKVGSPKVQEEEQTADLEKSVSSLNQTLQDPAFSDEENKLEQEVYEESDAEEMDLEDFHLSWSTSDHESEGTVKEKQRSVSTEDMASPSLGDAKSEYSDLVEETLKSHDCLVASHNQSEGMHESTVLASPDHHGTPSPDVLNIVITPTKAPPTAQDLADTSVGIYNLPRAQHRKPFFKKPEDVQTPKYLGGKKLWVPSTMPYDLLPFLPPCLAGGCCEWSSLEDWRTIVHVLQDGRGGPLPPSLHAGDLKKHKYDINNYRSDVGIRAQFVTNKACVISPSRPPPHPQDVVRWMEGIANPKHLSGLLMPIKGQNTLSNWPHPVKSSTPETQPHPLEQGSGESHTPVRHRRMKMKLPSQPVLRRDSSLIEAATPNNTFGFKLSPSILDSTDSDQQVQYLTTMSVEVHAHSRGILRPDPEWDPVLAIFYYLHNDWSCPEKAHGNTITGILAINLANQISLASPAKQATVGKSPLKSPANHRTPRKQHMPAKVVLRSPSKGHLTNLIGQFLDDSSAEEDHDPRPFLEHCGLSDAVEVTYVNSERELFKLFVQLVKELDPDILVGYEVQLASWGYLRDRADVLGLHLLTEISRVPSTKPRHSTSMPSNPFRHYAPSDTSELRIVGRVVLNLWRVMKYEIALTSYTYENVAYHVLHERVPYFTWPTLTMWYEGKNRLNRHKVIEFYLRRCQGNLAMIDKFNLIGRTSELARLYGIEFYNVLSRGSQYRVESMMLRLAKPANFIPVSPNVHQRARMAAPECLPLIMEPESQFYSDPVLVLDFQSLYPSMVIGYNYCYSTCLGPIRNVEINKEYVFGACSLEIPADVLEKVKDDVTISPNGIVFVKPTVRRGILPRMLEEILGTRIMVKQSMKLHKQRKALYRMLDARQLGLKLIANVTYGYTGASYSGRMPCVEIADSIVRKGRETLERAIHLVHSTPEWRARVVYGDTDSLFVLLKGVSKDEAFRIGKDMCSRITADNPKPIKLKFEKVYLPCLLQTKKRYVGFMYESEDQKEPVFDAKGIETVRRDGCPAVAKMLEKSLRLLFSERDVSTVKTYVQNQFLKILEGRVSLQDYTIAKEYRGRGGYRPGACVPALELAKQATAIDRRNEPRVGERVPYVIIYGSPGLPLIQLVRRPEELLGNPTLRLNGTYYITKQIVPALDRAFSLIGVDVLQWYMELPRIQRATLAPTVIEEGAKKGTIGQYFTTLHCPVCENLTTQGICVDCRAQPSTVAMTLLSRVHKAERNYCHICQLCQNCCGDEDPSCFLQCVSMDCPVFHARHRRLQQLRSLDTIRDTLSSFLNN